MNTEHRETACGVRCSEGTLPVETPKVAHPLPWRVHQAPLDCGWAILDCNGTYVIHRINLWQARRIVDAANATMTREVQG